MKRIIFLLLAFMLTVTTVHASPLKSIHEFIRDTPFPQEEHTIFFNPTPLIVPLEMKKSDFLQFNLSPDKNFTGEGTLLSEPLAWNMFNPHRELKPGVWYWRFRSVSKGGKQTAWSETYQFTVEKTTPVFVTPTVDQFINNIPRTHNRIYCFLQEGMPEAQRNMRLHPEYDEMIVESRDALAVDFRNDTAIYNQIDQMYKNVDKLNTAYQLFRRDIYAEKMVQNVRCFLCTEMDKQVLNNDFHAGDLSYILACTYETCYDRFTSQERQQIEQILMYILDKYMDNLIGRVENLLYEEHFWQFSIRHFLQASIVLYEKYPNAKKYLEYLYELWTDRAPASGFNRDGNWHNGTNYFSANAITLYYVPALFSHLTRFNFFQHPWYQNAGIGLLYSWLPGSLSAGFGDGHESTNPKPRRIRSAFADLLARTTGDSYMAWYSAQNNGYTRENETRLFRMALNKPRPQHSVLPVDAPKAVWFKDTGEMIANSDLKNLSNNLSLSFRSSPFGSGNHTHSNQNAFNLLYKGKPVYRSVGHYMNYQDPHNILSYRNTRAHNTLMVDGIGQAFSPKAYGRITHMFNGNHIAYALGDASNAYRDSSDVKMWHRKIAQAGLSQSRENGFGSTPLKNFKRHILFLYPDIIVIYDDLEASKAVTWNWLLHSPIQFDIEGNRLITHNLTEGFYSVAQIFGSTTCKLEQTDEYVSAADSTRAQRGENFRKEWTLTANFRNIKTNRILTVIQVQDSGKQPLKVIRTEKDKFQIGNWMIEAELDVRRSARLQINNENNATLFSYGKEMIKAGGKNFICNNQETPVLYDQFGDTWEIKGIENTIP